MQDNLRRVMQQLRRMGGREWSSCVDHLAGEQRTGDPSASVGDWQPGQWARLRDGSERRIRRVWSHGGQTVSVELDNGTVYPAQDLRPTYADLQQLLQALDPDPPSGP